MFGLFKEESKPDESTGLPDVSGLNVEDLRSLQKSIYDSQYESADLSIAIDIINQHIADSIVDGFDHSFIPIVKIDISAGGRGKLKKHFQDLGFFFDTYISEWQHSYHLTWSEDLTAESAKETLKHNGGGAELQVGRSVDLSAYIDCRGVDLTSLPQYAKRMLDEYEALKDKIHSLSDYLNSSDEVGTNDDLRRAQLDVMKSYLHILGSRLNREIRQNSKGGTSR